jgi:hypothetical protein
VFIRNKHDQTTFEKINTSTSELLFMKPTPGVSSQCFEAKQKLMIKAKQERVLTTEQH